MTDPGAARTGGPPLDLRLIVITDLELARPRSLLDVVDTALLAGAPALQLRLKDAPAAELYRLGLELRAMTRAAEALLFINDRVDVALALGADGVHLGPTDLPVAAARRAAAAADGAPTVRSAGASRPSDSARSDRYPQLLIGASTDDPGRARQAVADGADYIGCGAVFGTASKPEVGSERIGTDRLRRVVQSVSRPVVGIGGITPANVEQVALTGAAGAAVISAVMSAEDVGYAVQRLLAPFGGRSGFTAEGAENAEGAQRS